MDNKPKDFSYNQAINLICDQLQALGITADISYRVKEPYSILHKLLTLRKRIIFTQIYQFIHRGYISSN